jgi:hypothetical protein
MASLLLKEDMMEDEDFSKLSPRSLVEPGLLLNDEEEQKNY